MNDDAFAAKRAIVIAGPTASGKSALAMAVAERLGGVVINADSMQVYADLAILTARPTAEDMTRVPHSLFGHVDAAETYSVGRWLREVDDALSKTWAEGRVPVVVGGTGLYLKALTQGLSAMPTVPDEVRMRLRTESEKCAPEVLHARLLRMDPAMAAKLRPTDPQRILRALEIFEATGESLLHFQNRRDRPILPISTVIGTFLDVPRDTLRSRISERFKTMLIEGAVKEVEALQERNISSSSSALRALGIKPIDAYLNGKISYADAIEQGSNLTLQYAKRQSTFARHQLPDLQWRAQADVQTKIMTAWEQKTIS